MVFVMSVGHPRFKKFSRFLVLLAEFVSKKLLDAIACEKLWVKLLCDGLNGTFPVICMSSKD